jgi:hypothetical protein
MKKFFVVAMLTSIMLSCQESKENAVQKLPKQYDRRVGEQIPLEVANRWVNNFSGATSAGRQQSSFSVDADVLSTLLVSVEEKLGVVLHHATDESNAHHLLLFTMDVDGQLFSGDILDVSSGTMINASTAKNWATNYAEAHPATPWYHFFGSDIFSEIQSNEAFDYVDITRALNENNEEQILLFVYNTKGVQGGRSETEVLVFDKSNPCPPCSL